MDIPASHLEERTTDLEVRLKELELRAREVELPLELARLAMRGTLTAFIAGASVLVALAVVSIFATAITGMHLCLMAGIVCGSVALYGGFVFHRAVGVALKP